MNLKKWWGRSASVDLHDCDEKLIANPRAIKKFTKELCALLNMKRHGATKVERFGSGELCGWSMMQFIETSSITAHFDEGENRAFIDIFSCKEYDADRAAQFCKEFFKAGEVSTKVLDRA
mgnify:FL=1